MNRCISTFQHHPYHMWVIQNGGRHLLMWLFLELFKPGWSETEGSWAEEWCANCKDLFFAGFAVTSWFVRGDVLHRLKLCDFGMSKKFKVHSLAVMSPSFPTYVMQLYRRPELRQPDKTVGVLNKVQIMDAELMGSKSMVPSPSNKYTWQMGAPWSRGVRGFPLAMVFATVLPALRARNASSTTSYKQCNHMAGLVGSRQPAPWWAQVL